MRSNMFHKEHFCHVSSTNRGCPQYSIYVYKTTDSVETMLSAGYFNGALLDLHKNDVILAGIISDIDDGQYSTAWFRVIKRSLDAIEVEQVLTSADNITYDGTGTNYLSQFDNVQDAISALDAELKKESTERTQGQESLQGQIDGINEKIPETASASNQLATESDINTLQGQVDDNSKDIEALQGAGGALTAYNFNTATPTQETLTKYAIDQIWAGNTNWAWNAANPAASIFTDASGVARTAAEIFNSTWVNNTYDDHRWQLTNTQNTEPKVFEWADVGRDIVSVATATTAGIVRVGDGSQMVVNPATGDISLDGTKAAAIRTTIDAPGLSTENEYTDNAIYPLQKGIILQGANGEKYTIRTDGSSPSGFIIYEGESSANTILSFQPSVQNSITIGNISYKIKAGSSASLTSNDKTVATTEWVRDIIAEQTRGDFVQYWDSGDAADHSHAKPGVATPASGTWYRLYKSGWVEQGVTTPTDSTATGGTNDFAFTFPIPMKSAAYTIGAGGSLTIANIAARVVAKNTTGITAYSQEQTVRCSNIVVFGWAA